MPEVMNEVIYIAQADDEDAIILHDEDYFANKSVEEIKQITKILLILARNKIMTDYDAAPPAATITKSIDKDTENMLMAIRILLSDENDFDCLVYFGGLMDENTTLKKALEYIAKVLVTIEDNLTS